ncbi:hypothetical protein BC831DRAFT_495023 [Entophlyctis helioformis]|nr:hypothetical protein BC831DRAFT_495023 [Entophlyctis helioformis]
MANPPIQATRQPPSHTHPTLATSTPRSDCPMLLMPTSCSPTRTLFALSALIGAKGTCLARPAC